MRSDHDIMRGHDICSDGNLMQIGTPSPFSAVFPRETAVLTLCLLPLKTKPFHKGFLLLKETICA